MRTQRSTRVALLVAAVTLAFSAAFAADEAPLLVRWPTLGPRTIVFDYGDYLWSVPREGGEARQLTSAGHEGGALFSPDGRWIAFNVVRRLSG